MAKPSKRLLEMRKNMGRNHKKQVKKYKPVEIDPAVKREKLAKKYAKMLAEHKSAKNEETNKEISKRYVEPKSSQIKQILYR